LWLGVLRASFLKARPKLALTPHASKALRVGAQRHSEENLTPCLGGLCENLLRLVLDSSHGDTELNSSLCLCVSVRASFLLYNEKPRGTRDARPTGKTGASAAGRCIARGITAPAAQRRAGRPRKQCPRALPYQRKGSGQARFPRRNPIKQIYGSALG
jgi:hypothetical protein